MFNPVEIILKKRTGHQLTLEEQQFMVQGYITHKIPDYQMSALAMAIFFKGMSRAETVNLTKIFIESGSRITFPSDLHTVDKHSTGGVGDKLTFTVAPILAACGAYIPMISGRGLGHTGGTLDKLESIPGFSTSMTQKEFKKVVEKDKLAIIAQSADLVPADKMIYALRDVTGTVESIPLICASIMSKKIAEGAQNLVIDLKVGSGAFMKNIVNAKKLGELLKYTGEAFGQKVTVVYTRMDAPIGYAIGNALEIKESIQYLRGQDIPDLDSLTKALSKEMLLLTGLAVNERDALKKINHTISSGEALKQLEQLIKNQKGNPEVVRNPDLLPTAEHILPILAHKTGYIYGINSQKIGYALIKLGAGRTSLETPLNMGAGAIIRKKIGDAMLKDEQIGEVHTSNIAEGNQAITEILSAIQVGSLSRVGKTEPILGVVK